MTEIDCARRIQYLVLAILENDITRFCTIPNLAESLSKKTTKPNTDDFSKHDNF